MTTLIIVGVIIAIIVIVGLIFVGMYNGLVTARNRVKEAWSGIDVQLKRRASLVPNLVETVRSYAEHERGTFEAVTRARARLEQAGSPGEAAQANNMLTQTLRSLFAVAEAYPQLQAAENFRELQRELSDIEEKIAFSRQFYNSNVLDYNNRIQTVPTAFIASMFGFTQEEFFEAEEEAREDVHVDFGPRATEPTPTATTGSGTTDTTTGSEPSSGPGA